MTKARGVGCIVACILLAHPVAAQDIRGVVSERDTYAPVELASVLLLSAQYDTLSRAVTDTTGFFTIRPPADGDYYVVASALGYQSVRSSLIPVAGDEVMIVELTMAVRPVRLGGLLVEGEREEPEVPGLAATGFYERFNSGWGEFLLPGEVAAHPAEYTPQLFREMLTVQLEPSGGSSVGPWNDRVMLKRHDEGALERCEPDIYIDDVLTELMPGEGLEDAVPREFIEAIEVHVAPFGGPLRNFREFGLDACGVVLIWTRRGWG